MSSCYIKSGISNSCRRFQCLSGLSSSPNSVGMLVHNFVSFFVCNSDLPFFFSFWHRWLQRKTSSQRKPGISNNLERFNVLSNFPWPLVSCYQKGYPLQDRSNWITYPYKHFTNEADIKADKYLTLCWIHRLKHVFWLQIFLNSLNLLNVSSLTQM